MDINFIFSPRYFTLGLGTRGQVNELLSTVSNSTTLKFMKRSSNPHVTLVTLTYQHCLHLALPPLPPVSTHTLTPPSYSYSLPSSPLLPPPPWRSHPYVFSRRIHLRDEWWPMLTSFLPLLSGFYFLFWTTTNNGWIEYTWLPKWLYTTKKKFT